MPQRGVAHVAGDGDGAVVRVKDGADSGRADAALRQGGYQRFQRGRLRIAAEARKQAAADKDGIGQRLQALAVSGGIFFKICGKRTEPADELLALQQFLVSALG